MKYYLTIGSKKFDFLRLKFGRIVTMESKTAEILIAPAKGSTRPAIGDVVLIEKELDNTKTTKWQGKVWQIQDIPLENDVIKIIAYDLKYKINFLNVKNSGYATTKGSSILTTELETSSVTDLTAGTISTSDSSLDTVSFGKSITGADSKVTKSAAFEIIQILSDRDIYIKRDGTVDFGSSLGTDRSLTHILEHRLNCTLAPDIGYSEDETRRVKQVIVKGSGTGNNFILGTAGTPLSTDKVKQIDLPYIPSNATATLAATTIYNELNKTNKFAKVILSPDVFITNYDVFDTVRLKARLTNKTIDENLRIYSIETIVSAGDEVHETVTIELQNFIRAQLATMTNPIEASSNQLANITTGISFTQASNNTLPTTFGSHASVFIEQTVLTPTSIASVGPFSSQKTSGAYFHFGVRCVIRNTGGVSGNTFIRFRVSDGTTEYPISQAIDHYVGYGVGDYLDVQLTYFIPADVAGKTLTLIAESNSSVDVTGSAYAYSLGL